LSSKPDKHRINVTMPETYVKALDCLLGKGLFRDRSEVVLDALRYLFRRYGIEPFATNVVGPEKDALSEQ